MKIKTKQNKRNAKIQPVISRRDKMLSDKTPFSVSEAYRAARTNLLYLPIKDKCRKLAVTSAISDEGKTIASVNLSLVLAQSNKKVILVDADMRRPQINQIFQMEKVPGLSEYLVGITDEIAYRETEHKGLFVLPSGHIPLNPSELLSSERIDELFERLERDGFDYIMIDTPPLNAVTDSLTLASKIHGYIFVVHSCYSNIEAIKKAVFMFEQVNATIFGFLLNAVKNTKNSYTRYKKYYYGRYDSGYAESNYYAEGSKESAENPSKREEKELINT